MTDWFPTLTQIVGTFIIGGALAFLAWVSLTFLLAWLMDRKRD